MYAIHFFAHLCSYFSCRNGRQIAVSHGGADSGIPPAGDPPRRIGGNCGAVRTGGLGRRSDGWSFAHDADLAGRRCRIPVFCMVRDRRRGKRRNGAARQSLPGNLRDLLSGGTRRQNATCHAGAVGRGSPTGACGLSGRLLCPAAVGTSRRGRGRSAGAAPARTAFPYSLVSDLYGLRNGQTAERSGAAAANARSGGHSIRHPDSILFSLFPDGPEKKEAP